MEFGLSTDKPSIIIFTPRHFLVFAGFYFDIFSVAKWAKRSRIGSIMVKRIYEKAKSILFSDPEVLYQEDRGEMDKSFYFPGTNGKAVLLIHGWTSVPYEVHRLGIYLNEKGYTVSIPMLKGHGTHPKDLLDIKWEEWLLDVEASYDELKKEHKKVYVGGTSMGANLTVMLAKDRPEISGLLLMAMPYAIRKEKITFFLAKLLGFFKTYQKKYYPPGFGNSEFITRRISYRTYPIKSAMEVFKLVKVARQGLPCIEQPCFVMQSTSDHVVSKKSLENIFAEVSSKIKRKKYIQKAYHTFISDIENEHVFDEILDFFEKN